MGDLNMSIRILEKSIALAPGYQKSLADLAMNYILQNNSDRVKEVMDQAEREGVPRTHHKFEMVHMYLTDLERNMSHVWTEAAAATDPDAPHNANMAVDGSGSTIPSSMGNAEFDATRYSPNPDMISRA